MPRAQRCFVDLIADSAKAIEQALRRETYDTRPAKASTPFSARAAGCTLPAALEQSELLASCERGP
jgi:hypothetical protein